MVGIIESGATVLVEAAATPRPGQIWLCVDDEARLVVHRVRGVADGLVTSRGSGNDFDDEPLPIERLVGRVRSVVDAEARPRTFGRWDQSRSRLAFRLRRIARRTQRLFE